MSIKGLYLSSDSDFLSRREGWLRRRDAAPLIHKMAQAIHASEHMQSLAREVNQLRRANEILCEASACFAMAGLARHGGR